MGSTCSCRRRDADYLKYATCDEDDDDVWQDSWRAPSAPNASNLDDQDAATFSGDGVCLSSSIDCNSSSLVKQVQFGAIDNRFSLLDKRANELRGGRSFDALHAAFPEAPLGDLWRFARARSGDPDAAVNMYAEHLEWRRCGGQERLLAQAFSDVPPFWVNPGIGNRRSARDGTRVIFAQAARTDFRAAPAEAYALSICHILDEALKEDQQQASGVGMEEYVDPAALQVTVVVDCRPGDGLPNTKGPSMIPFFRIAGRLLGKHYPERLKRFIIYPVPPLLCWMVGFAKRILDPVTFEKLVLIPGPDHMKAPCPVAELSEFVSKESLPPHVWGIHAGL